MMNTRQNTKTSSKLDTTRVALSAGIYWGAIWGLYEATIGWLVHFLPRMPGTASVVMIPFAVFCMDRALRNGGGTVRAAVIAAGTAAMIKLVDFYLPARSLQTIVNPAVSILLQGMVFAAVAHRLDLARRLPSLKAAALGALVFSAGWRLLFLIYSAALAYVWSLGMLRDGLHTPWGFMVRDALLSAASVLVVMWLAHRRARSVSALPSKPQLEQRSASRSIPQPGPQPAPKPAPGRLAIAGMLILAMVVKLTIVLVAG